jgi:hypothetical protein
VKVALAAAVVALVACAPRPYVADAPDRPYQWIPVEPSAAPVTVPVSLFEVTYSQGAELHRAVVDASTLAEVSEISLGKGSGLNPIAGTASVIVDDDAGVFVVNGLGERHRYWGPVSPLPIGGIASNGAIYIAKLDGIAVTDIDGNVLRSFDAPRAQPGVPVFPPGFKGKVNPNGSWVQGFAFDDAGSFVVVRGGRNSAIVDLDSGARADLMGFGVVDVASHRGRAYLLGSDTTVLDSPYVLVEIDLATLTLLRTTRFAVDRPLRSVNRARLVVTPGDDVYAFFAVPLGEDSVPTRADLVAFDRNLGASHVTLPDDLGLDATSGADGALYLFGGPARNIVTRFDPLTRALTPFAVAPPGAYVRTLAAR